MQIESMNQWKKKRLFCVFKSFAKNHRRHFEYENNYICCLSLFAKWWKNFQKIKSRNSKWYIETLQKSRFIVIFFNWIQRKIIQFWSTFFDDNENINLLYNRKRNYWSSNLKLFDDANEIELIVQSQHVKIIHKKN